MAALGTASHGERGPEIRPFGAPGQITPLKNVRGDSHQSNITVNVNGVDNFDAFRRSESQIMRTFYRGLKMRQSSRRYSIA